MSQKLLANSSSQRARILEYLQTHPNGATTQELVEKLDILRPGARVSELRKIGNNIVTHSDVVHTRLGQHKNARYVLLNGSQNVN